jgi:hypothetical protein
LNNRGPRHELAGRLRSFREDHWPGERITQPDIARALGGLSVPSVSSWESTTNPKIPPLYRLDAYAMLFCTSRSLDNGRLTPVRHRDLTDEELEVMSELRDELRRLRSAAMETSHSSPVEDTKLPDSISTGPWHFNDDGRVTIVCARLPADMLDQMPYARVDDPDYIDLHTYSELDSLFELYGHLRASNPTAEVERRIDTNLDGREYQGHLVVLGGIDWNRLTGTILERLRLPIRQVADWTIDGGQYFEGDINGATSQYRPELRPSGDDKILDEDVALFVRAVNPFNPARTVTICNGMYGRGTYGVIRALTDPEFRDRNTEYLRTRFGASQCYCILSRVQVIGGKTLTPDWAIGDYTLFEWSTTHDE